MDTKLINVIILGCSFHLLFFAYETGIIIQQTVLNSLRTRTDINLNVNGYIGIGITYAMFAIFNWITPVILKRTGLKYGLILGTSLYAPYSFIFLYPSALLFYLVAASVGVGAAIAWSAQGSFLSINSTPSKASRDAGLFWSIFQSSLLTGNLFTFFAFNQQAEVTDSTRYLIYGVLGCFGIIAPLTQLLLTSSPEHDKVATEVSVVTSFRLLKTRNILHLLSCFICTGLFISFFTGVWGTAIGATSQFGLDSKKYIGLSGIALGVGQITGGLIFRLRLIKSTKRDRIVIISWFVNIVALALIFINIPADAPLVKKAQAKPIIEPRLWLALMSSTLIGFADASINTQIYSLMMSIYTQQSISAFGLFKFIQAASSALAYLYSTKLDLYYQIYILVVACSLCTINFCIVDRRSCQEEKKLELA